MSQTPQASPAQPNLSYHDYVFILSELQRVPTRSRGEKNFTIRTKIAAYLNAHETWTRDARARKVEAPR